MTDSQSLIADYVKHGSEAAFRELTARYLDLVYSTAVRLADGDTHLAEDVTQTVFMDLARLAKKLPAEVRLGGWLHRHTCFVAANILRGERRRRARERRAVEMNATSDHSEARLHVIAPVLDEAINQLGAVDRTAVLLRFYEPLDFEAVGAALGITEAAAQKRVARALEKLLVLLKHRGVTLSAAGLSMVLTSVMVMAAPAGLAASISGTALASVAAGTGTRFTWFKLMATTKLQTAIIAAIVVASITVPLLVQRQAQASLRDEDETLRRQAEQIALLTADNERVAGVASKKSAPVSEAGTLELLKLRSEVGRLKKEVQEMAKAKEPDTRSPEDQLGAMKSRYAAQVERLKQWLAANPGENIPELAKLADSTWLNAVESLEVDDDFARAASNLRDNAALEVLGKLALALRKYAADNGGQFPTDLSQLKPYLKAPIDDAVLGRYEIVPSNSLVSELQPGGDWAITQKGAANPEVDLRTAVGLTEMRGAGEEVTNRWNAIR